MRGLPFSWPSSPPSSTQQGLHQPSQHQAEWPAHRPGCSAPLAEALAELCCSHLTCNLCSFSTTEHDCDLQKGPPCCRKEPLFLGVGSWTDFYLLFCYLSLNCVHKRPQFPIYTHSGATCFQYGVENIYLHFPLKSHIFSIKKKKSSFSSYSTDPNVMIEVSLPLSVLLPIHFSFLPSTLDLWPHKGYNSRTEASFPEWWEENTGMRGKGPHQVKRKCRRLINTATELLASK